MALRECANPFWAVRTSMCWCVQGWQRNAIASALDKKIEEKSAGRAKAAPGSKKSK